jgi:hypothetical protein
MRGRCRRSVSQRENPVLDPNKACEALARENELTYGEPPIGGRKGLAQLGSERIESVLYHYGHALHATDVRVAENETAADANPPPDSVAYESTKMAV